MENKINIAELLKDCPQGMELDCTLFEGLEFDGIVDNEYLPIRCRVKNPNGGYNVYNFTKYGCWIDTTFAKCVIFPKGKTTWEGFVPHCKFKNGDFITMENERGVHIFIYNHTTNEYGGYGYYVILTSRGNFKINKFCSGSAYRLATEEEKAKLFDAIKAKGYKWNPETKTLNKLVEPKFKVGDRIRNNISTRNEIIKSIEWDRYILACGQYVKFTDQDEYELVQNKFDINTLKAFDKVLVRCDNNGLWNPQFFAKYRPHSKFPFTCTYNSWSQCVPYEGNEHLLDTTDDCNEFYKTWE